MADLAVGPGLSLVAHSSPPQALPVASGVNGLARVDGLARWLAPDLALAVAVVAVIYLLAFPVGGGAFFGGATGLFRDSDAGWHIRAGERMLATGTLPRTDPFSFPKAGAAWIAWEWLADVLVGAVHRSGGLAGVAWLYTLAIGASVWMWFRLHWVAGGNFLLACVFASPLLSTTNLHWLARPHVLGWLFLLGSVWFLERMPEGLGIRHLLAAGLTASLWANMHGSFFLGPTLACIWAAGAWLGSKIWDDNNRDARPYLYVAAAACLGTLVNPNGWQLHRHVLTYLSDSALLDRIGEFQSFNFHAEGSLQIILGLLIGVGGGFAALSARRPERFLLAMLLTGGALRSARMLPVAALVLLPFANGSITAALRRARLSARVRRPLDGMLAYGDRLRTLDRGLNGLALVPVLAVALLGAIRASHPGFPADQFPVAASNAVAALPAAARIFAPDKFGGYLIYRFGETGQANASEVSRKVFFDGRSDFYGADFLRRYSRMVQVRPGWTEEFARWRFTHALLPVGYSLVAALEAQGWTELYRDRTTVLLGDPKA